MFQNALEKLPHAGRSGNPDAPSLLAHAELLPAYWMQNREVLKAAEALCTLAEAKGCVWGVCLVGCYTEGGVWGVSRGVCC